MSEFYQGKMDNGREIFIGIRLGNNRNSISWIRSIFGFLIRSSRSNWPYHSLPLQQGLTTAKAEELLKKHGPNALEPPKTVPEWVKFMKTQISMFALLLWVGVVLCVIAFLFGYFTSERPSYDYVYLVIINLEN